MLSHCLINLYVLYIKQNDRLNEAQAAIMITWRIVNNSRYTVTPPLCQNAVELKSLLMNVKNESEKAKTKKLKVKS